MTTDTPKKMSTEELANARAHYKIREGLGPVSQTEALVPRLLRHIDALKAERAPALVDREALGWAAYLLIEWNATECAAASVREAWDRLRGTERRERYCRIGEALHALGARSRDAEVAALRAAIGEPYCCPYCYHQRGDEVSNDTRSTREQMTAEIERLTAELAEARSETARRWTDQDTAMRAAAFADGAREERERLMVAIDGCRGAFSAPEWREAIMAAIDVVDGEPPRQRARDGATEPEADRTEIIRLTAELAQGKEALAALAKSYEMRGDAVDVLVTTVDTARAEGEAAGREAEREACLREVVESGPDTPELIEAQRRIRARGPAPCSCFTCDGSPAIRSRMYLCATCGNKRCPRATDCRLACTGSNEPGQSGSAY